MGSFVPNASFHASQSSRCVHFGTLDSASQSEMIEEGWTPQCSGCEPSEILTRRTVQYRATKIGGHHRPLSLTQASRQ
jgi:hypothetical protein